MTFRFLWFSNVGHISSCVRIVNRCLLSVKMSFFLLVSVSLLSRSSSMQTNPAASSLQFPHVFLSGYSFISFSSLGSLNSHFLYYLQKLNVISATFLLCILLPTQLTLVDSVLLDSSTQPLLHSGGQSQNQPSLFLPNTRRHIFSPTQNKK